MNIIDYTYLLNKPNSITEKHTSALENVLDEFPFFQSARALRLKGLYNQNSFKYNYALKVTAAHTTDRAVLFDFITSDSFTSIQRELFEKKANALLNITVVDHETIVTEKKQPTNSLEESILTSIKEAVPKETSANAQLAAEKLELGTPLDFSKTEKHSFQEWLQLSRIQPIVREPEKSEKEENNNVTSLEISDEKRKKAELIDKFIETSPKISPVKPGTSPAVQIDINKEDHTYLMTETLARVYLEQKKYQKAIQAYEILILKYPEKSSFFADRISDIKILQQNN
ncbi:tetratricopeptide repeat protein [Flavobacterium sp. UMI-01]|uniref:tetratricopeptide repeat protein n=1 Tax=Flavobacterium sp. UMI-01 TaxID=1441053 RepID=UPI001C7E171E|nr:tetratricopeptide repeat protein [Flavobacterium sp. UMI-01]GIZ08914.1 hypothetical protein FUMI01_16410 [Flavobacterium sp. UMI-01]